jgi:hypothetical protein
MEAISSSETSVDFQRNTRRHIPEDSILFNYRCENLKSFKPILSDTGTNGNIIVKKKGKAIPVTGRGDQ